MQGLRYNPTGTLEPTAVLGQAAALAGSAAGYNQRRGQDIAFINSEYDRRARAAEFAQNNALEAQKLQMAGALSAARGSTPTSSLAGAKSSPFTQQIQAAKQQAIDAAINRGDVDRDDPTIALLRNSPDVGANQTYDLLETRKKEKFKSSGKASTRNAKKAFLSAQPPEIQEQFGPYIDDDETSLAQLRTATADVTRQGTSDEKSRRYQEVQGIDDELRFARNDAKSQAAAFRKATGHNIDEAPSWMSPTVNDTTTEGAGNILGIGTAYDYWTGRGQQKDAMGKPTMVSGGDKDAMEKMQTYYALQNQIAAMEAQRAERLGAQQQSETQRAQTVNTPAPKGSKQMTPAMIDHFMQQAGGNKAKAKQMALEAGYGF